MSRQRFWLLLIAAVMVLAGAMLLVTLRNPARVTPGMALFPSLAADLQSINRVSLRKGGSISTTLEHSGAAWTVTERAGYPADVAKLRNLLTALSDAKVVEEKTSDATRFAVIGVEDPGQPGASGTEITIVAPGRERTVIVGKSSGDGTFVRRGGEKKSYSVAPAITAETEPQLWIDSRLLDLPVADIQRIDFKPAGNSSYAVRRSAAADDTFELEGVPAGRKPSDPKLLAPSPSTFSGLNALDVSALDGLDFSHAFITIVTLKDGNVITLTGAVAGSKHWLQIHSTQQTLLTAKLKGRAFEVASYRYDALFRPVEQLLAPRDHPASAPGR